MAGRPTPELRKHSEELQAKVVDLQHDSGVFAFGQTDSQGHDQVFTPALDQLQQATTQLEQAQSARIMKGALYQVVKNGDPEHISGLAGNGMLGGLGGRERLARVAAEPAQRRSADAGPIE